MQVYLNQKPHTADLPLIRGDPRDDVPQLLLRPQHPVHVLRLLRQYLYCCTSNASKLRTAAPAYQ
jgi:hypothetical protein